VSFEKRNVLDSHDPVLSIPKQENEIVSMEYGGFTFRSHPGFNSAKPTDQQLLKFCNSALRQQNKSS
jgi:hypothetical protein